MTIWLPVPENNKKNIQYTMQNILRIASIALHTLRSSTRASAELWNVRPNRLLPVHQWWNVGFAFVYWRSFFNGQLSTTCDENNMELSSNTRLGFKTCFSKTKTKTKTLRFQDQDQDQDSEVQDQDQDQDSAISRPRPRPRLWCPRSRTRPKT